MKSICLIALDRYLRQERVLSVVATTRQRDHTPFNRKLSTLFNEGRANDDSWS